VTFFVFFIAVLFEYIVVPVVLATPSQSLMSILVVSFSLIALNYKKKTVVTTVIVMFLFIVASIGIKTIIRDYFYGQVYERVDINNVDLQQIGDVNINTNREKYNINIKIKEQSITDPNFYNINIIPESMHDTKIHYIVSQGLRRVNHLKEFLYVIETTPNSIVYKGLSIYKPILYIPIPRILFPNKPVNTEGQSFGHDYKILSSDDNLTSININPITEGWTAYGVIGVVFSAVIFLIFLKVMFFLFVRGDKLKKYLIMSIMINATLISESNLYGIIGGVFWTAILSFVLVGAVLFISAHLSTERY